MNFILFYIFILSSSFDLFPKIRTKQFTINKFSNNSESLINNHCSTISLYI